MNHIEFTLSNFKSIISECDTYKGIDLFTFEDKFLNSSHFLKGYSVHKILKNILFVASNFNEKIEINCTCKLKICPVILFKYYITNLETPISTLIENIEKTLLNEEERIIISGSRSISFLDDLCETFNNLNKNVTLILGDAEGIDLHARNLAEKHSIKYEVFKADWGTYGKSAGMIRNLSMIESGVDFAYLFLENNSRGTSHMKDLLTSYQVEYSLYQYVT